MINSIQKIYAREQYKLAKACKYMIDCKEQNMLKPTVEYLIAEQKVMNETMPGIFEAAKKVCKLQKTLYYYRKKYNNEGVTKIAERFIKSKPYIYAHNAMAKMFLERVPEIMKEADELVSIIPPKKYFGLE